MAKKKTQLPAMPFYFGDWRKAPEIRALDLETRMIWFEILGFMWESTERGYLTLNSKPIEQETLARMIGIDEEKMKNSIQILEHLEVFSRRKNDGAIYNRKMVRDNKTRDLRAKGGKLGGNPTLKNKVKHKVNLNGYPDGYPWVEPSPVNANEDENEIEINTEVINSIEKVKEYFDADYVLAETVIKENKFTPGQLERAQVEFWNDKQLDPETTIKPYSDVQRHFLRWCRKNVDRLKKGQNQFGQKPSKLEQNINAYDQLKKELE